MNAIGYISLLDHWLSIIFILPPLAHAFISRQMAIIGSSIVSVSDDFIIQNDVVSLFIIKRLMNWGCQPLSVSS